MRAWPRYSDSPVFDSRIYWLLGSDGAQSASRVQGLLIHRHLVANGYDSRILYTPPWWLNNTLLDARPLIRYSSVRPGDIVIIQKLYGRNVLRLINYFNSIGAFSVFVESDLGPFFQEQYVCTQYVCPSKRMQEEIRRHYPDRPVHYIPDPIEKGVAKPRTQHGRSYRAVWVGNKDHWAGLQPIQRLLREEEFGDLQLVTISDHPDATYRWSLSTVFSLWATAGVCVVPTVENTWGYSKSNNRVKQAMALGLPVVCGTIPAYRETVINGVNGFLCDDLGDYRQAFRALRDPDARNRIAVAGWNLAIQNFAAEEIVRRWIRVLRSVPTRCAPREKEKRNQFLKGAMLDRRCRAELWLDVARRGGPKAKHSILALVRALRCWPCQVRWSDFAALLVRARRNDRHVEKHS